MCDTIFATIEQGQYRSEKYETLYCYSYEEAELKHSCDHIYLFTLDSKLRSWIKSLLANDFQDMLSNGKRQMTFCIVGRYYGKKRERICVEPGLESMNMKSFVPLRETKTRERTQEPVSKHMHCFQ